RRVCAGALLLRFCAPVARPLGFYALALHDALPIYVFLRHWTPIATVAAVVAVVADHVVMTFRHHHRQPAPQSARHTVLADQVARSEEHTSELQSRENLVCRLLLEKKNLTAYTTAHP